MRHVSRTNHSTGETLLPHIGLVLSGASRLVCQPFNSIPNQRVRLQYNKMPPGRRNLPTFHNSQQRALQVVSDPESSGKGNRKWSDQLAWRCWAGYSNLANASRDVSSKHMIGRVRGVLLAMAGFSLKLSSYDALRLTLHRDGPDDLVASAADDRLLVLGPSTCS